MTLAVVDNTTTNRTGSFDADGDGVPNSSDPDPFNPADGNVDSDGDGMTDWQEALAGTTNFTDTGVAGETNAFYRVRLVP